MKIKTSLLNDLAKSLEAERKRQKLSREEAAAVCGVSASFIRDVEANPENCSLGKLVRLISGLGLSLNVDGLHQVEALSKDQLKRSEASAMQLQANANVQNQPGKGLNIASLSRRPDFGVSDEQLVQPLGGRQPLRLDVIASKSQGDQS